MLIEITTLEQAIQQSVCMGCACRTKTHKKYCRVLVVCISALSISTREFEN